MVGQSGKIIIKCAFISKHLDDALRSGEKDDKKQSSTNNPYTQTREVLSNPENPDSN